MTAMVATALSSTGLLTPALAAFAVGLVLGSFANVVIARVPRGESIVHPGSHCPNCTAPVRAYDNIPVVSWVVLRGRCRDCGWTIPARYPLVELTSGCVAVGLVGMMLLLVGV